MSSQSADVVIEVWGFKSEKAREKYDISQAQLIGKASSYQELHSLVYDRSKRIALGYFNCKTQTWLPDLRTVEDILLQQEEDGDVVAEIEHKREIRHTEYTDLRFQAWEDAQNSR